ncbi:MAG: hypothetical protein K940chlam9_01679 [Chlamydiae bacterium]|nr:hypothetical protein [Chlamydiota bacterium]
MRKSHLARNQNGRSRFVFRFFIFVFACLSSLEGSVTISPKQADILSAFFKEICECEAGYVFYDKKPLCLIPYSLNPSHFEPKEDHRCSTAICVAKEVLQNPRLQFDNIMFHFDDKDEYLLIINKKEFLKCVEKNLVLFQYLLGPNITPQSLLNSICSNETSFCETVRYDRALIGILLGYGTQNSLYQSRYENLDVGILNVQDLPPYKPLVMEYSQETKEDLVFFDSSSLRKWGTDRLHLKPSLGFFSLEEEKKNLEKQLQGTSGKLKEKPYFIFGYLPSKETNQRLEELESTQKKIKALLKRESFLEDTLSLLLKESFEIEEASKGYTSFSPQIEINSAIAKLLYENIPDSKKECISAFINGFVGVNETTKLREFPISSHRVLEELQKAKSNLEQASLFFHQLKESPTLTPAMDSHLYFSILNEGKGPALQGDREVLLDFEIFDPSEKCLNSGIHTRIQLGDMLPAIAHGMQNMKIGEKRLLFIHPAIGYGIHTLLEKGMYLKVVVTLHHIYQNQKPLPPLEPVDLSFILDKKFQKACLESHLCTLESLGAQKRWSLESFGQIQVEKIQQALNLVDPSSQLSYDESMAIYHYFWDLYFGKGNSNDRLVLD